VPGEWWIRADYLHWWTSGSPLPPLLTTSPVGVVPPGTIGAPTTTVLFGDELVNTRSTPSARFRLGRWCDPCHRWGIEAEYFSIGGNSTAYEAESTGVPVLARPFYDTVHHRQTSLAVAYPGLVGGEFNANVWDDFQSAAVWARYGLLEREVGVGPCRECRCFRLDAIGGYRFFNYRDNLLIRELEVATDPSGVVAPGTMFRMTESFRCRNEFHGVDLGLVAHWDRRRWSLDVLGKVAVGNNRRTVAINGTLVATYAGTLVEQYQGGLLALPSNIGNHVDNDFVVIPQVGVEIGYQFTSVLRGYVGYDLLYWSDVVRPGSQIDLNINTNQLPPNPTSTDPPPTFAFNGSGFWAQGVSMGLELRY
jgi:hypothetical protein